MGLNWYELIFAIVKIISLFCRKHKKGSKVASYIIETIFSYYENYQLLNLHPNSRFAYST